MLSEYYDESYNICLHNDTFKPLSQVRFHDSELHTESSMEYKKLKEFANLQIGKFFNLSFLEYIQLPLSTHAHMSKIAIDLMKKTNTIIEDFKNDIEN